MNNGNPKDVVEKMIRELECMSKDAYESLQDRFKDVFEQLTTLRMTWSENEDTVDEDEDEDCTIMQTRKKMVVPLFTSSRKTTTSCVCHGYVLLDDIEVVFS